MVLMPVPIAATVEVAIEVVGIAAEARVVVAVVMAPVRLAGMGTTTIAIAAASQATGPKTAEASIPRRTSKFLRPRRKNQHFFSRRRLQSDWWIQSMPSVAMATSLVEMWSLRSSLEVEACNTPCL
jgi:hypothetical protein